MPPLAMRWAPNQTTAIDERFTTVMTIGNISASIRPVARDILVSSVFAPRKRSFS